jgi:hypothetical protein
MGRAKTRANRKRVINKRKGYTSATNRHAGQLSKGGCFCSCEMCANPRRSKKDPPSYTLTRQELKDRITVKEQV